MTADVEQYLAALSHRRAADVRRLRDAILALDARVDETVKWNAPNFRCAGQDRVTFRLHPREPFDVVLHCGAVASGAGPDPARIDDPSGLIRWKDATRGVIAVPEDGDDQDWLELVLPLVRQWLLA